jgi:hypothetical protein
MFNVQGIKVRVGCARRRRINMDIRITRDTGKGVFQRSGSRIA